MEEAVIHASTTRMHDEGIWRWRLVFSFARSRRLMVSKLGCMIKSSRAGFPWRSSSAFYLFPFHVPLLSFLTVSFIIISLHGRCRALAYMESK